MGGKKPTLGANNIRAPFSTVSVFVSCLQQQTVSTLNEHCSANGHMSVIYSNSSLIAHSVANRDYFALRKRPYGHRHLCSLQQTLQFVVCFRLANVRCEHSFSRANIQQNVCCVRCTERTPGSHTHWWCLCRPDYVPCVPSMVSIYIMN